jgi:hypothetical protein
MKKLFAGMMVSMLLVLMMGTTVFAALSPTAEAALAEQAKTLDSYITPDSAKVGGKAVTLNSKTVSAEELNACNQAAQNTISNAKVEARVLAMTDLYLSDADKDISGNITVRLKVTGVNKGDTIDVLHYDSTTKTWEKVAPSLVEDGYVTVTLSSLSPVAIVREEAKATTDTVNNYYSSYTYVTNPASSTASGNQNSSTDNNSQSGSSYNTPDDDSDTIYDYTQGYNDGFAAGRDSVEQENTDTTSSNSSKSKSTTAAKTTKSSGSKSSTSKTTTSKTSTSKTTGTSTGTGTGTGMNTSAKSPKTGAALPALPILAVFASAGILACGRKAKNQ